jgi:hypothetical protein
MSLLPIVKVPYIHTVDITPQLTGSYLGDKEIASDRIIKINPSIAPVEGNIYIMSYRAWGSQASIIIKKPFSYYKSLVNLTILKYLIYLVWPTALSDIIVQPTTPPVASGNSGAHMTDTIKIFAAILELLLSPFYAKNVKVGNLLNRFFENRPISEYPFPIDIVDITIKMITKWFMESMESRLTALFFILEQIVIYNHGESTDLFDFLCKSTNKEFLPSGVTCLELKYGFLYWIFNNMDANKSHGATELNILHPYYNLNWHNYLESGMGFALLHIDPVTKNVVVIREWIKHVWPIAASHDDRKPIEKEGDARIIKTQDEKIMFKLSASTEIARFTYYISTDCQPGEALNFICLGQFYLDVYFHNGLVNYGASQIVFEMNKYNIEKHILCAGKEYNSPEWMSSFENLVAKKRADVRRTDGAAGTIIKGAPFSTVENWVPTFHGRNWSMFLRGSNLFFSFQFIPHQVIHVGKETNTCRLILPTIDKYNTWFAFTSTYRFSLGTPAIPYTDREYIAVGHSRFNLVNVKSANSPTETKSFTSFARAAEMDSKYYSVPWHYYFMYFYTFDRDTFEIRRMSYSFQPPNHAPYLLVFPVGICYINEEFVISYGEGDIKSKLMFINRTSIEQLLRPIELMIIDPEEHKFIELSNEKI